MRRNPSFQAGIRSQCPARFLLGPHSGHRHQYFPHLCEEKCKNRKKNLEDPYMRKLTYVPTPAL